MLKEQPLEVFNIILNNTRFYSSILVQEFILENARIEFVLLPPYSPNLNNIERLRKFFKKNITYNEYYENFLNSSKRASAIPQQETFSSKPV